MIHPVSISHASTRRYYYNYQPFLPEDFADNYPLRDGSYWFDPSNNEYMGSSRGYSLRLRSPSFIENIYLLFDQTYYSNKGVGFFYDWVYGYYPTFSMYFLLENNTSWIQIVDDTNFCYSPFTPTIVFADFYDTRENAIFSRPVIKIAREVFDWEPHLKVSAICIISTMYYYDYAYAEYREHETDTINSRYVKVTDIYVESDADPSITGRIMSPTKDGLQKLIRVYNQDTLSLDSSGVSNKVNAGAYEVLTNAGFNHTYFMIVMDEANSATKNNAQIYAGLQT